jgi:hypothetical protein
LDIVQVDESGSLFNFNSVDLSRPRSISFQLEVFNVIGGFRDVEDIFRDQLNRRIDSNDYSCIYLVNAIPSEIVISPSMSFGGSRPAAFDDVGSTISLNTSLQPGFPIHLSEPLTCSFFS